MSKAFVSVSYVPSCLFPTSLPFPSPTSTLSVSQKQDKKREGSGRHEKGILIHKTDRMDDRNKKRSRGASTKKSAQDCMPVIVCPCNFSWKRFSLRGFRREREVDRLNERVTRHHKEIEGGDRKRRRVAGGKTRSSSWRVTSEKKGKDRDVTSYPLFS